MTFLLAYLALAGLLLIFLPVLCKRCALVPKWFDIWVGIFWNQDTRRLYVFPVPMLGLCFDTTTKQWRGLTWFQVEPDYLRAKRPFKRFYLDGTWIVDVEDTEPYQRLVVVKALRAKVPGMLLKDAVDLWDTRLLDVTVDKTAVRRQNLLGTRKGTSWKDQTFKGGV